MEEEEEVRAEAGGEHRDAVLQEDPLEVEGAPGRQAFRENSSFFKSKIFCVSCKIGNTRCVLSISKPQQQMYHKMYDPLCFQVLKLTLGVLKVPLFLEDGHDGDKAEVDQEEGSGEE